MSKIKIKVGTNEELSGRREFLFRFEGSTLGAAFYIKETVDLNKPENLEHLMNNIEDCLDCLIQGGVGNSFTGG